MWLNQLVPFCWIGYMIPECTSGIPLAMSQYIALRYMA